MNEPQSGFLRILLRCVSGGKRLQAHRSPGARENVTNPLFIRRNSLRIGIRKFSVWKLPSGEPDHSTEDNDGLREMTEQTELSKQTEEELEQSVKLSVPSVISVCSVSSLLP
jgi:hypothetical protein